MSSFCDCFLIRDTPAHEIISIRPVSPLDIFLWFAGWVMEEALHWPGLYLDREMLQYIDHVDQTGIFCKWLQNMPNRACKLCKKNFTMQCICDNKEPLIFSKITTILLNSYRLNISNYLWWSNSLMLECFSQTREPKPCTEYASLTPSTIITVSLSIYKLNSLCSRGRYVNCLHVLAVRACYLFYWINLYNMIFNES